MNLYLRLHHRRLLLTGWLFLAVDTLLTARAQIPVVARNHDGIATVPLPLLVPLALVALLVSCLDNSMPEWEALGGTWLRTKEQRYLTLGFAAALATVTLPIAFLVDWDLAAVLGRALAIWMGMALLSARLLGPARAWVLPLLTFLPVNYFGTDVDGHFYSWYWPRQPWNSPVCALIAAASMALGFLAYYATPWRVSAWRRRHQPGGAIASRDQSQEA